MRHYLFLYILLSSVLSFAQSAHIVVESITLEGNHRTKDAIIFRELDFGIGDTLNIIQLPETLERNQQQVLNTGMFTAVQFNIKNWDDRRGLIQVHITMRENWYIYPIPIFELADRNFNVWWEEQNRSLDRINFGLRFYHINFTGRRDLLKLVAQYGYTQKYELEYTLPSFNKAQTWGLRTNWFFSRNKEVNYATAENKQLFRREEDDFLIRRIRFSGGAIYRPRLFFYHNFDIEYHHNTTDDLIAQKLNPDFFLDAKQQQRFFALRYAFAIDRRDIKPYPQKGNFLLAVLRKDGLGIFNDRNALILTTTYAQYINLPKKWSLELIGKAHLFAIREQQPYYNSRALGFEPDFLRGYELYVIDGLDFGYIKSSLRFELMNRSFSFGKAMPFKKLKIMPLRIYLSLNGDSGFANDPYYAAGNPLSNRLLYSAGLGLDIISYYDKVAQIQFSVNHLGEKGVFLHHKFIF